MKFGNRLVFGGLIIAAVLLIAAPNLLPVGMAQGNQQTQNNQADGTTDRLLAIVGASNAGLFESPNGEQIQQLSAGAVLSAVGRTADNQWVVVTTDSGVAGWIRVTDVVMFGVQQLPVMIDGDLDGLSAGNNDEAIALPTVTPTPLPTATPTATETPLPSPTPTQTATPTQTPLPLPTNTPVPVALSLGSGLGGDAQGGMTPAASSRAVDTNGIQGAIVAVVRGGGATLQADVAATGGAALNTGTALSAVGRSADSSLLYVIGPGGETGWVPQARVVIFNVETLPVIDEQSILAGQEAAGAAGEPVDNGEAGEIVLPPATLEPPSGLETPPGDGVVTARVTLTASRLNIRAGPSTQFVIIGKADPDRQFTVSGRNADGSWLLVDAPDIVTGFGWIATEFVAVSGNAMGLPVSNQTAPASAAMPTPAAAMPSAPTAVPPAVMPTPVAPVSAAAGAAIPVVSSIPPASGLSGKLVISTLPGEAFYLYDLASGNLRQLTGGYDPVLSPDGSTVAYTRLGGEHGLYLIDVDGSNERRIFGEGEMLRGPSWSPDGRQLVYTRATGGERCRDVGFGICLPDNPFLSDFPLVLRRHYGLSRVDFNGENFRDIPALNSVQAPNWHPDGIVYQSTAGIEWTEDEPDATTSNIIDAPFYGSPKWRPVIGPGQGGDVIVFHSRQGSHWQIFSVRPDGSGMVHLTRPQTTLVDELPSNVNPVWSPDGQSIAFLSNRADPPAGVGPWRVWVMDADGGNQRPLPVDLPIQFGFGPEQMLSWSP